jgi:hypothetical protein
MLDLDLSSDNREVDVKYRKKMTPDKMFLYVVLTVIVFLVVAWILQLAWNGSMPKAFSSANTIGYSTALLLLIVAIILFPRKL